MRKSHVCRLRTIHRFRFREPMANVHFCSDFPKIRPTSGSRSLAFGLRASSAGTHVFFLAVCFVEEKYLLNCNSVLICVHCERPSPMRVAPLHLLFFFFGSCDGNCTVLAFLSSLPYLGRQAALHVINITWAGTPSTYLGRESGERPALPSQCGFRHGHRKVLHGHSTCHDPASKSAGIILCLQQAGGTGSGDDSLGSATNAAETRDLHRSPPQPQCP